MNKYKSYSLVLLATLSPGISAASEFGTSEDARLMLERAVIALQQDKSAALDLFNSSDGEYRDRDLYVFCGGPDGVFTAHPKGAGKWNLRKFKDISGENVGEKMYAEAAEGEFSEVSYLLARGDDPIPLEKTSIVTRVEDQVCGVGYFNPDQRPRTGNLSINSTDGVVIDGYDPVAYFTIGQATRGSNQFSYEWLETDWHFMSAGHREMFIADPIKYTPQYGGYCTSAMSNGALVPVDPQNWQIVDGKLYLYFSERALTEWSQDLDTNITKANATWDEFKPRLSN